MNVQRRRDPEHVDLNIVHDVVVLAEGSGFSTQGGKGVPEAVPLVPTLAEVAPWAPRARPVSVEPGWTTTVPTALRPILGASFPRLAFLHLQYALIGFLGNPVLSRGGLPLLAEKVSLPPGQMCGSLGKKYS